MQKKNRIGHNKKLRLAVVLFTVCFLWGCTRKEELILLTEETVSEKNAEMRGADMDLQQEQTVVSESAEAGGPAASLREKAEASDGAEAPAQEKSAGEISAKGGLLYVHVCGAVEAPGVYELPAGCRVYEAVRAAGGFSADADQNYVNQAQVLADGVKLVIPTKEEAAAAEFSVEEDAGGPDSATAVREKGKTALQIGVVGGEDAFGEEAVKQSDAKVNINTASEKELCNIPGVGATRAAAIAAYRESNGAFKRPEDIMKVNGIKEGMYQKIKDSICVE